MNIRMEGSLYPKKKVMEGSLSPQKKVMEGSLSPQKKVMEGSGKSEILEEFPSRELLKVEEIIAALKDESVFRVGIWDSSGARITSLTELIVQEVRVDNVFGNVVEGKVRNHSDRQRIVDQIIADSGREGESSEAPVEKKTLVQRIVDRIIAYSGREGESSEAPVEKKTLVILDDESLSYLDGAGIPWVPRGRSCKILITSQSKDACFRLGAKPIFHLMEKKDSEISKVTTPPDIYLFCLLFPSGYEFTEDMLVCQWLAEGLEWEREVDEITKKAMYVKWFKVLLENKYIVTSGYDYRFDQIKYKVADKMEDFLENQPMDPRFKKDLDGKENINKKVGHLSLASKEIDGIDFNILKQYGQLRTLILYHCYGSKLKRLPTHLFLELKSLKNLNLSHTDIVELPSSLEELMDLRYLDVSHTPIMWLPETMGCLGNLLMINLDGCLSLTSLPKSTSKLVNLLHLVLDVERQLESMPIGIGKLWKLCTLQSFLVGKADGRRIGELKDLNELRGSFHILNLENVKTKNEASEACLQKKLELTKIELRWSDMQKEKNLDEEQILESLQPPPGIQEVKIFFYSGGVLPTWISNPSFSQMVSITLYGCRCYSHLPSLGELPNLEVLDIFENNEVKKIKGDFCRKKVIKHHKAFPKLEKLSLNSMTKLEKWLEVDENDFLLLRDLTIKYCPKFKELPLLSHMKSLQCMEIHGCPKLSHLPKVGMSGKLECLIINDCPNLKARYGNEKCEDWSKIAHVRAIYIDDKEVSK